MLWILFLAMNLNIGIIPFINRYITWYIFIEEDMIKND